MILAEETEVLTEQDAQRACNLTLPAQTLRTTERL